ncbi:hypothetical protein LTR53_010502 [Teratosphaeriaceae sp. CCFEE 6253]|nr:hypothetical protein LTR53_010502 [Teratosphaeriaceae sp. CCFEE 6253]
MLFTIHLKPWRRLSQQSIPNSLRTQDSQAQQAAMCRSPKPPEYKLEDWTSPRSVKQELLVPAESEAGQNFLNPKVLHMLGVTSVVKFDLLPSLDAADIRCAGYECAVGEVTVWIYAELRGTGLGYTDI